MYNGITEGEMKKKTDGDVLVRHKFTYVVIRCKLSEVRVYMSPRPRSLAIRHQEDLQCVFFGCGNTLASLFSSWHSMVSKVGMYANRWGLCDKV